MNPRLMLSLWRERWGKAAEASFKVPYVHGKVNLWTDWLPESSVWSVKGLPIFALLSCLLLMGLMMCIDLPFESQVVFSVLFVCIALYIRRYAGTLITLVLIGMAVIASTRYLYWRLDATLVQGMNLDFMFGFYLWVAECYLALLVFTGLVQFIWPLKRASVPLPADQSMWPTVDVFILCDDQPYASIKSTCTAASKLDWPRKKIKIYLIDGAQRDDLFALAASMGAHYLPHTDESSHHAGFINRSLPSTNGEFIAVFESGEVPDSHFLQSTIGWFLRDQKLGMVQTLRHFLAPSPSPQAIKVIHPSGTAPSCVLMRRLTVTQAGGVDVSAVTQKSHMALVLQASGYTSAYIGFGERDLPGKENLAQNKIAEPISISASTAEIFLVEYSFPDRSIRWKQHIESFRRALQFYYPAPRLLFFATPVVYLLGNVQTIHSSPDLFVAYALPHFVIAHITLTRTDEKNRLKLFADVRETALAWYLMILTTLTLIRTECKQCLALWTADKSDPTYEVNKPYKAPKAGPARLFTPLSLLSYLSALGLNFIAFSSGAVGLISSTSSQLTVTVLYLLWAAYNLMLLAAMFATAQEARQVVKHTNLRRHLQAMIKLPSGRTVSCTTENFPASVLELSLPMAVPVNAGDAVSISIFHAHQELALPAAVVLRQDLRLEVRITDTFQKDYQSFATAVLSRGPDWPKWLPERGADHPFPSWMTNAFVAVPVATLDFAININKHLHWVRLDSWIQLWKRKK